MKWTFSGYKIETVLWTLCILPGGMDIFAKGWSTFGGFVVEDERLSQGIIAGSRNPLKRAQVEAGYWKQMGKSVTMAAHLSTQPLHSTPFVYKLSASASP